MKSKTERFRFDAIVFVGPMTIQEKVMNLEAIDTTAVIKVIDYETDNDGLMLIVESDNPDLWNDLAGYLISPPKRITK